MRNPLLYFLILAVAACGGAEPAADPVMVQTYAVEGTVAQLPAGPGSELMIRHAEIPDFVNAAGDTVGMNAMTMGFPLAEGVELDGFSVGDSVGIRFVVRWGQPRPLELVRIERR